MLCIGLDCEHLYHHSRICIDDLCAYSGVSSDYLIYKCLHIGLDCSPEVISISEGGVLLVDAALPEIRGFAVGRVVGIIKHVRVGAGALEDILRDIGRHRRHMTIQEYLGRYIVAGRGHPYLQRIPIVSRSLYFLA